MLRSLVLVAYVALGGCHALATYHGADAGDGSNVGTGDARDVGVLEGGGGDGDMGVPLVVEAPYPTLANWNDYVAVQDATKSPYVQSGVACNVSAVSSATDCVHAGQLRQVKLPLALQCDSIEYGDARQAFRWSCQVENGAMVFRTTGLQRGLAGLIEKMAFAPNQFIVSKGGSDIARSPLQSWGWNNPVRSLPVGYDTAITPLDVPGTVYVVPRNTIAATRGLNIAADGVSLLVEQGATLTNNGAIKDNCETDSGKIALDPNGSTSRRTVVCGGGVSRIWLEGNIRGDQSNVRTGVLLVAGRMSRLSRLDVFDTFDVGVTLRDGKANRIEHLRVWRVGSGNGNAQQEMGLLLDFETGLRARSVRVADALGDGIHVEYGTDVALTEVSSANNGGAALVFFYGSNLRATSVLATGSFYGVEVNRADGVTLAHVTAAHNSDDGVRLEVAKDATVIGLAALDNGNDGLDLRGSTGTRIYDALLAHHTGAPNNGGLFCQGCADNDIQGVLWVGKNRVDCAFSSATTPGFSQPNCTQSGNDPSADWGNGNSNGTLYPGIDCASCVAGRATSEPSCKSAANGIVAYNIIASEMLCSAEPYRSWGRVAASFPDPLARGRCEAGGSCALWDYAANGAPLRFARGMPTDGDPCPAAALALLKDRRGATVLVGAIERVGDGIGNDDGLCEQNEGCVLAPHLGADQRAAGNGSCSTGLAGASWPQTLWFVTP
ncbi:MAG: right-handed parallel beta-helix repeat-containing protein [Myxococcales bacterium]|nr:right-handed parallel beta-helix repeat-containing protein [Myxococcales bacterium]